MIPDRPNSALLKDAPVRQLAAFTVDLLVAFLLLGVAIGLAVVVLTAVFNVSPPYGNPIFEALGTVAAVGLWLGFGAVRWRMRTPGMRLFRL